MPRSKRKIGLGELRVGLLVLIAIGVFVFLILNASGELNPFASHLHLRARFPDANGLREGSEVRLAGVRIGKVSRIRLMTANEVGTAPVKDKIEVSLTIDNRIDGVPANERIRTDSTAQQSSPSLLGSEMIVNITPGTALGQPVTENFQLTSNPSSTMGDLATTATDTAAKVGKLTDELNDILKNVREGKGTVGRLFNDEALYNKVNRIADRVNHSMDQIDAIVADVNAGRGTLGRLVKDEAIYNDARAAIARFNTTAERIDNVVAGAQRGEGTLGKLITDEQLYNNVNNLSSEGVKLMYDFRQNPKKYLTIKFQLF